MAAGEPDHTQQLEYQLSLAAETSALDIWIYIHEAQGNGATSADARAVFMHLVVAAIKEIVADLGAIQ